MSHNECPIALNELLDSVGLNKGEFAELMNVNRKTVTRWLVKNETTDEMLAAIDKYKLSMTPEQSECVPMPEVRKAESKVVSEFLPVTHENIAKSCTWHHLDTMDKAATFGLRVWQYNQAIQDTVGYCKANKTSFQALRA